MRFRFVWADSAALLLCYIESVLCSAALQICTQAVSSLLELSSDLSNACMQMYRTKSGEEQGRIVTNHYAPDARFVDPLMDVGTPREIHLAFFSLIKIFKVQLSLLQYSV